MNEPRAVDAEHPDLIAELPGVDGGTHFPRWMGVQLEIVELGRSRGRLPAKAEILNYRGVFHGGAVSTLADVSMISAVKSMARDNAVPVTASLQVNFLGPGRDCLLSEGRVVRVGGGLGFATVTIRDAAGTKVAVGSGVFRLMKQ